MNTDQGLTGNVALTESIIGAAYKVSNTLGSGFLEKVYENALAYELRKAGFEVRQQHATEVWYESEIVGLYQADLIVNGEIVVELKAVAGLDRIHRAQCLNYLRATRLRTGLVINFGLPKVEIQRVASH
ncbi:MAG TPA: GxxExxY protein [Vicinamibacterales bacterium]